MIGGDGDEDKNELIIFICLFIFVTKKKKALCNYLTPNGEIVYTVDSVIHFRKFFEVCSLLLILYNNNITS